MENHTKDTMWSVLAKCYSETNHTLKNMKGDKEKCFDTSFNDMVRKCINEHWFFRKKKSLEVN